MNGYDPSVARSFDDLFGDTGWRGQIPEGQGREDAILSYYKECLRRIGGYQYVVNTAILKRNHSLPPAFF